MQSMKFVGWVEKVFDADMYSREFVVRDFKNDEDPQKPKYPTWLTFKASVKNGSSIQLDNVDVGDKVQVEFYLTGKAGVSHAGKYYHINSLQVAKDGGVIVIEKSAVPNDADKEDESTSDGDELPF